MTDMETPDSVRIHDTAPEHSPKGEPFQGRIFTGPGPAVVESIARETGQDGAAILALIVKDLLVNKGADWTSTILSEYLGLYQDSSAIFTLIWNKLTRQLVSHAAIFQSATHPAAALLAHVRTLDEYKGRGLGTRVTEEVTHAAFKRGASTVILATDDKMHRILVGETAAHGMYLKLGYSILAEKRLADTIDWLMVVDPNIFELCQAAKQARAGRFPKEVSPEINSLQQKLIDGIRERLSQTFTDGRIEPVGDGDLANLFLLLNLCPPDDFRLKLVPWGVHLGPELERAYVINLRPAIADRDRLDDASLVLRDQQGAILAVCAARLQAPFTRNAIEIDFYCLPRFLARNQRAVMELIEATLTRIRQSIKRPRPCRILFSGIDPDKNTVFQKLGFTRTINVTAYYGSEGKLAFESRNFEKIIP